jgi:predicted lysophospholipase L1 biosynthesis ABC-type transport system permease subunit
MAAALLWMRSNLRAHWRSAALVVVIAGLCSGSAMAAVAGARRTTTSYIRFVADSKEPQVFVFTEDRAVADLAFDVMRSDVDPSLVGEATFFRAKPASVERRAEGGVQVVGSHDDTTGRGLSVPKVVSGRLPMGEREIAINEVAANNLDLGVGDPFAMVGYSPEMAQQCHDPTLVCNADVELGDATVTAVLRRIDDITPDLTGRMSFELSPAFTMDVLPRLATTAWIAGARVDDAAQRAQLAIDLTEAIGADRVSGDRADVFLDANSDGDPGRTRGALDVERNGLLILALLAAISGLIAVPQALARQQSTAHTERDRLAALGFTRRNTETTLGLSSLAIGAASAIAGIGIAIAASPLFPIGLARRAEPVPGLDIDATVLAIGGLATVVFVVVAGLIAARLGSRRSSEPRLPRFARLFNSAQPVPATAGRFMLDGGRLSTVARTTATASVLGVALIVCSGVLLSSEDRLVGQPALYGAPWDIQGQVLGDHPPLQVLRNDSAIAAAAVLTGGRITIEGREVGAAGVEQITGQIEPTLLKGRMIAGDGEIVLSPQMMADLGIALGDVVAAGTGVTRTSFTVVGVGVKISTGNYESDLGATISAADFAAFASTNDIATESTTEIAVRAVPGADLAAIRTALAPVTGGSDREIAETFRPARILNITRVRSVPQLIAVFAALLLLLVLAHALATVATRRRSDLAVLRALGMRVSAARRVMCWHGGMLAVIALGIGIPTGVVGGRLVWKLISDSVDAVDVSRTPYELIVVLAGVLLATGVVVGTAVAHHAVPRSIAPWLRSE